MINNYFKLKLYSNIGKTCYSRLLLDQSIYLRNGLHKVIFFNIHWPYERYQIFITKVNKYKIPAHKNECEIINDIENSKLSVYNHRVKLNIRQCVFGQDLKLFIIGKAGSVFVGDFSWCYTSTPSGLLIRLIFIR